MPEARIELDHQTPLQLLVAVILSAQCTDRRVNMVTPALFKDFPTPEALAQATPEQLHPYLQSLGLFRNKAKNLVALAQRLVKEHGGAVPVARASLAALPGVGNKTAGVVSMHAGGDDAFPVDTHVARLAARMGLSRGRTPDQIELDLRALLPIDRWFSGHQLLVWHGRRVCHARAPECDRCVARELCPKKGVKVRPTPKPRTTPQRARP